MHTHNKVIIVILSLIVSILILAMSASALIGFTNPEPSNKNATYNPRLSILVEDSNNNDLTIVFETNATGTWETIGTQNGEEGIYYQRTSGMEIENQKYYWRVKVFDGATETISPIYNFTAQPFILKWAYDMAVNETYIGPLAVDVNNDGIYEVFATGEDKVVGLNGLTGEKIWEYTNTEIPLHAPFDIHDLNNDGTPELVVAAEFHTIALHADDGSVYWDVTVRSGDHHLLVLDTDGNKYPYVYITSADMYHGENGTGRLRKLRGTDGTVMAEVYSWKPCWGGISAADANNDGKFEIYMNDRNTDYSPQNFAKGLQAYDADDLTLLWSHPEFLASSQVMAIVDVDNDGVLDAVGLNQKSTSGGICVIDGATGEKMPGKCDLNLGLGTHSPFPIYDIDGDGNLELITARDGNATVWDMTLWQADAVLDRFIEPPKMADVIGDDKLEIVGAIGDIWIYNGSYALIEKITSADAIASTIVQDIDNDDQNELIGISSLGVVQVYETSAYSPTPRIRTNNLYYSERHMGAAVYVPLPGAPQPIIKETTPIDGAINVELNPTLSAKVIDFHYDLMDIDISTNASGDWENVASFHDVGNDWYSYTPTNMNGWDTTYYWKVTAVDPHNDNIVTEKTFKFTTKPQIWEMPGWAYRKQITIDYTKVNGTLNNFPVLIEFTDSGMIGKTQEDGDDILFTLSDGTKLAHEIESYDELTGHLVAWVNVPILSSIEDTILYMYYGNDLAENQQSPEEVWDSNYLAVHHLEETEGTIITDSTDKNNDGSPTDVILDVEGKLNGADEFNGVSSKTILPQIFTGQTQFTVEGWYYLTGTKESYLIAQRDLLQNGMFIRHYPATGEIQMFVNGKTVSRITNTYEWHHVVGTYDGTIARMYIDDNVPSVTTTTLTWPNQSTYIGDRLTGNRAFQGKLDEIRISDIARSAAYITTSFNNQNDPTPFIIVGEEEAAISKPAIINELPAYREIDVLFNITELSFDLWDNFNDPMDYTVSTSPDIGSASASGISNGRVSVPVSGLQPSTEYTWYVDVTDGVESAYKEFTFKTIRSYNLTMNITGSGAIVPSLTAPYAANSEVQLAAIPSSGWAFLGWNGNLVGSEKTMNIIMNKNKFVNAIFGPIGVPLIADSSFNAVNNDDELRTNAAGQDWYDSRQGFSGQDPTLLTLNTENIGGNSGKKAKLAESTTGNSYLSQEFVVPQPGRVSVEWDVYIDTILNYRDVDRAAHQMIGVDTDGQRGPNSAEGERFLVLAFYHKDGSSVPGANMSLIAQEYNQSTSNSSQWKIIADDLQMDQWYNIRLDIDVQSQTYDAYVNDVLRAEGVGAFNHALQQISHISFATWNDGIGTFYIDNVQAESLKVCIDNDNDGYGVDCTLGADCDDSNAAIHPEALEICDSLDNDCDTNVDEDDACLATEYYCDVDSDSYISSSISGLCLGTNCVPSGCAETPGNDCNDNSAAINPAAADESCNGVDENCNGINDESYISQITSCGIGVCITSGDTSCIGGAVVDSCIPLTSAFDSDWSCNSADDDCDGLVDEDYFTMPTSCGLGACAATGDMVCISGVETDTCTAGAPTGLDDDCNNIDENCDGTADNNYVAIPTTCGVGACAATGQLICSSGLTHDTCTAGTPGTEVCEGSVDENCDGTVDDNCDCTNGEPPRICGSDVGECIAGTQSCIDGTWSTECVGETVPVEELCNNLDDDCDGAIDESLLRLAENQNGLCAGNNESCIAGVWSGVGTPSGPASDNNCNNIDDDCDGTNDEDYIGNVTNCFGTENCHGTGQLVCINGTTQDTCVTPPDGSCSTCGDGSCNGEEDCSTCTVDCGTCGRSSGGGGGGGGGGSLPSDYWTCGDWSVCIKGKQTQDCTHGFVKKTNTQTCTVKKSSTNNTATGSATASSGQGNNAPAITTIEGTSTENEGGENAALSGASEENQAENNNEITGMVTGENTGKTITPWIFIGIIALLVVACAIFLIYKGVKKK